MFRVELLVRANSIRIVSSLIINKAAVEKGLFGGCKFTFYKTELEQREEFANPDATTTTGIKSACYDKLENGIIRKGVVVHKNDVIIGKIMKLTKQSDDEFQYVDRSIIYKDNEDAIVHNVIVDRNEEDERFCKVVLRKIRQVTIGDKFSSRSGQKGVCGTLMSEADMPFTEDGIRPSFIFNPHQLGVCMLVTACKFFVRYHL